MSWQQRIDRALDERRAAEAFRRRLPVSHGAGRWLEREGERWLNFSSNDYLGLSQHGAIIAAWQRGDIDGAYVWAPAVNELEKEGKVLTDSAQVGQWGAPTLDVWVVRKDFAEQHPEIVKAFAKSAIDAQQPYIANPEAWLKQPENLSKLSRLSGVPEADVPVLVKGNTYLTAAQQAQELNGPVNQAIIDTAKFLKEQGKVPAAGTDYSQFVTDRFVK